MPDAPRATYRLQLRQGMDLARAVDLVPYLARLGVSHLYLSPPFTAAPGSTHGYDVVDPNRIDPALGGEDGFAALSRVLKEHGLGLVLDIVPNHMGIGRSNPWWWDVLRRGQASRYARFFDIDFAADPDGKLVLPVLGAPLDEVIRQGELRVTSEDGGEPLLAYFDQRFPLAPGMAAQADLPGLLAAQSYRLISWREGAARRNYRRFFNIDQLAGLRVEEPEVFEASHELILDLARRGLVQGLRVDHVDGLTDPMAYLTRLRQRLAEVRPDAVPFYVLVEKILIGEEQLSPDWPVAGTTGYEFLNDVMGTLVARPGLDALTRVAERFVGAPQDYAAMVSRAKAEVLERLFPGEWTSLARKAAGLCGLAEDVAADAVRRLLIGFPVYRTYGAATWGSRDAEVLGQAFDRAAQDADAASTAALARLEQVLAGAPAGPAMEVVRGLQQLSGPLMAKSVEDTTFYRHHRLIALNEVGGEPDRPLCELTAFHGRSAHRLEHWPDTMLATATHDTKRGEDARARLLVLSELPEEWAAAVAAWRALNAPLPSIHPADEYALYQSLVGAWPPGLRPDDAAGVEGLRQRLEVWLIKALREAKERSDWQAPDTDYERRATSFLGAALSPDGQEFLSALHAFVVRIEAAGRANGLGQLLLKLTAPGVPDIYQGTEFWDHSLVDPDNRRPIDFATLLRALSEGGNSTATMKLRLMAKALAVRARYPRLFARGAYQPLAVAGEHAENLLAFARSDGEQVAVTVIGRLLGRRLLDAPVPTLAAADWGDTAIVLPAAWPPIQLRDCLGETPVTVQGGRVALAGLLRQSPVALLAGGKTP